MRILFWNIETKSEREIEILRKRLENEAKNATEKVGAARKELADYKRFARGEHVASKHCDECEFLRIKYEGPASLVHHGEYRFRDSEYRYDCLLVHPCADYLKVERKE